jgi:cytochrome c oxidase cbb3-type subunit 3
MRCAQRPPDPAALRRPADPHLTTKIWLYSGTKAGIVAQIINPKAGVMPTWEGKLDPIALKSVAIYVHDLGGGE